MKLLPPLFLLGLLFQPSGQYDMLIKNGHVIDPKNGIDGKMDIALKEGLIAAVAEEIPEASAQQVVDASGLYVVPGLIDLHTHVFHGTQEDADYSNGYNALPPDGFTFRSGVTTIVDVGGSGWRDFHQFKRQTIDRVQTRVLAFLNIVGHGMKGGPIEQDLTDMDARLTAMRAREFPEMIVGIKVAHYGGPEWDPVKRAVEAGEIAGVPVMIDFGRHMPPLSLSDLLLVHLRPGDIFTHVYAHVPERQPIVQDGKVAPHVVEARKRGLLFDVGHGAGSFVFRQAIPAMEQGFPPDTISSDLHIRSMNAGMKDLSNVMSKFLNLGMPLQQVIEKTTWRSAQVIQREDLGHLSVGSPADVAVLRVRNGEFGFLDVEGSRLSGDQKLECELTLREGRVVWDLNGLTGQDWKTVPVPF
ncbi:MAG: amidohydrolase/deacetylase family metallohydrolase [Acidobacteriota bacterium]|nr:MAG: amidohydrolase/deacetylase family metallohydrolase [Acidobacteriota bacterium]